MNKHALSFALALLFPAGAFAGGPELPTLSGFKERLREMEVPNVGQGMPVRRAVMAACPIIKTDGQVIIESRMFSWSTRYEISVGGAEAGAITSESGGYDLKDSQGLAAAYARDASHGKVRVMDCSGEVLGEIRESERGWNGERSFEVYDAAGAMIAKTGLVEYLSKTLTLTDGQGRPAASFKSAHWFFDRWEVDGFSRVSMERPQGSTLDLRLATMVFVYNHAADSRESQKRSRERREHHGRGDR